MLADDLLQLADEAKRRPVGESDAPAGPADADEFARRAIRAQGKHDAERAHDKIEGAVGVWQLLHIAFVEADREIFACRPRASLLNQVRRKIDSGYLGAGSCGREA